MQAKERESESAPIKSALILCDYGQVLAGFDRSLCAIKFQQLFGRPLPAAGDVLLQELLTPFESGALSADAFLEATRGPLQLTSRADDHAFQQAWCSILWAQDHVIALIRRLAAQDQTLVHIVTNTDPWRLAYASSTLGMADLFTHYTASFEADVQPKGLDSTMWALARRRGLEGAEFCPEIVVGIDDVEANLSPAIADGSIDHGIVFTDVQTLERELCALGLYVSEPTD